MLWLVVAHGQVILLNKGRSKWAPKIFKTPNYPGKKLSKSELNMPKNIVIASVSVARMVSRPLEVK